MSALVGVYFRHDDYASFWLRLLVGLMDVVTAAVLCLVATFALGAFVPPRLILFICALIFFCYSF